MDIGTNILVVNSGAGNKIRYIIFLYPNAMMYKLDEIQRNNQISRLVQAVGQFSDILTNRLQAK